MSEKEIKKVFKGKNIEHEHEISQMIGHAF
jgi:hypothetical protein